MGQIGCLGNIVFTVSSKQIETIKNAQWSGSTRYGVHQRHLMNALTEFTGIDPDRMSFEITLSSALGTNTMKELVKIWTHERSGTPLSLVLGKKFYGKHKWCIENHTTNMETYDKKGNLTSATVSINLIEYLNV